MANPDVRVHYVHELEDDIEILTDDGMDGVEEEFLDDMLQNGTICTSLPEAREALDKLRTDAFSGLLALLQAWEYLIQYAYIRDVFDSRPPLVVVVRNDGKGFTQCRYTADELRSRLCTLRELEERELCEAIALANSKMDLGRDDEEDQDA